MRRKNNAHSRSIHTVTQYIPPQGQAHRMKFISLFSGIGGFDLGFERAGMECVAQVEIDEFCQKVLAKHWPNVPKFKDVKDVGKHNLPATDVIVGGFPCQPHSYAGKRRGAADDRNLWPEYLRVIEELRPGFVVGENVPGLITTMLDQILSDLEGIGYTCQAFVIPACAFDAPHRRNRVFILAKDTECNGRGFGEIAEPVGIRIERNSSTGNAIGVHPQSVVTFASGVGRNDGRDNLRERSILSNVGVAAQDKQERERWQRGTGAANSYVTNPNGTRLERQKRTKQQRNSGRFTTQDRRQSETWDENWIEVAARLCRVDDGLPVRLDGFELSAANHRKARLRALGNAVVPQVAEWIGNQIMMAVSIG